MFLSGVLRFVPHPSPLLFVFSLIVASFLTGDSASAGNQIFGAMVIRQVSFPLFPPLFVRPSIAVQFGPGAQVVSILQVIFALLFSFFLGAIHVAPMVPGEHLLYSPSRPIRGDPEGCTHGGVLAPVLSFALTSGPFVLAFRSLVGLSFLVTVTSLPRSIKSGSQSQSSHSLDRAARTAMKRAHQEESPEEEDYLSEDDSDWDHVLVRALDRAEQVGGALGPLFTFRLE